MPRLPHLRFRSTLIATLTGLLLTALLFGGTVRPASAHALYEKSQPASGGQLQSPGQIMVWFTEPVEPGLSELHVLDTARKRVDLQDTALALGETRALTVSVPELPDGTYTVAWSVLSAVDGHVTRGVFPLVVGAGGLDISVQDEPAPLPNPLDVLARWIAYVGTLALAGAFVFRAAIAGPVLARFGSPDLTDTFERRQRRYGLVLCVAVILAMLLGMLVQAANAANVDVLAAIGSPVARLLGTQVGTIWGVRLGCVALMALVLWLAPRRLLDGAGVVAGAALLLSISLISHSAGVPTGTWLAIGADWVHQLAAASWVGGLFAFVLLLAVARPLVERERFAQLVASLVPRFSTLAIVAVALLAGTGLFLSWLQVKTPGALVTMHGLSLVVKLLLIAPMLVLGALNLFVAKPGLAPLVTGRRRPVTEMAEGLVRRFNLAIVAEAGLALAVLLATGFLTSVQPAREEYARRVQPLELAGQAENVDVKLQVTPARPGPNQFVAELGGAVAPPNEVQRVTLRFTNIDDDLGSSALVLQPRDDGRYAATSTNLTTEGTWQIEVVVRRRGLDDARTAFRSPISSPDVAAQPPSLDAIPSPASLPPRQLISMALMATGLALTFWISRTRDVRRRERFSLYAASFAVAMIGGVLYARASLAPPLPQDVRAMRNPFPPDTASIARGRELYEQQCVSCHGQSGRGDGPLAASLRPRPADFRVHMAAGHTDGELFTWLSKGVPGTAMPPFEGQLSETDRWHLVNFIRGFAPTTE
jgi:copper transport protein